MTIGTGSEEPTADARGGEHTLRIFLNYRRDDSAGQAGRLYDALVGRFGENVFMDVDRIEPGLDFHEVVAKTVATTDVLLAVIGTRWLDPADEGGRPRLQDPEDFVRIEIRAALEREGTRVIPVLVQGAAMPSARDLPEDLVKLARRNSVELRDARWADDVSRLVRALERIAAEKAASEGAVAGAGIEEPQPAESEATDGSPQAVPGAVPDIKPESERPAATRVESPSATQESEQGTAIRSSRRLRPVWLAAGIAGIAAAVAVGVILVGRGGGGGETIGFTWSTLAVPGPLGFGGTGHQEMHGVAASDSNGAVAVGYDQSGDGARSVPAVWKYDSSSWRRVLAPGFGNDSVGAFHGVATQGETIVAVGVAGRFQAKQDALVWTFSDGRWRRVCREACGDSVSGGGRLGQGMWAVAHRSDGGFVAVGYDVSDEGASTFDAAVWSSPDGLEWERVRADPKVFGGTGNQVMRAITETGSGLLVAVGVDDKTGAVWTSAGGRSWVQADVDAFDPLSESGRTELSGITVQGDHLVAVGFETRGGTAGAAAWISDGDPAEWRRLQTPAFSHDGDQKALGVAATDYGTVAVGYDHDAQRDNQVAAAWLIDDDGSAQRIENAFFRGAGDREMNAAIFADGRLLAVGDGPSLAGPATSGQDARVWVATRR